MATSDLHWTELDHLLQVAGSERFLAQQVEVLRSERGWSQQQLADRTTGSGSTVALTQSAISRLERPPKNTPVRGVRVDEALALARAFEVPLSRLLLPPEAFEEAMALAALREGPEVGEQFRRARFEYQVLVSRARLLLTQGDWQAKLEEQLRDVTEKEQVVRGNELKASLRRRREFLTDVLQGVDIMSLQATQASAGEEAP